MDLLPQMPQNEVIGDNFVKAWTYINRTQYSTILCDISGGSDSDLVLDICCRCDKDKKIHYAYYDTGIEYKATKDHLDYLENKYGVTIYRYHAYKYGLCVPTACKIYGQPFLSKQVSEFMMRLQMHDFQWEDESYEVLINKYPNCISALKWWCNNKGNDDNPDSKFGINRNKWLKEFIIANPPRFKISNKCCQYAKKDVYHKVAKEINAQMNIYGVRKAEGGARASAYKSCFSNDDILARYRPIWHYKENDKRDYEAHFGIVHSECYSKYGLQRTGCVGCPFGRNFEEELEACKKYEPNLYKAVCNIFKDSYEYTKQYRNFCKVMNEKAKKKENYHQMSIWDYELN